jgi:site-specific recombinase XerD
VRLIFSSPSFFFAGRSRPGFPILLGEDSKPLQPFQDFLIWWILERGKVLKPLTLEAYGRALWDFARFLQANSLQWNSGFSSVGESVVSRYRDWSLFELQLTERTVNARLRVVVTFFEWAYGMDLIDRLPFDYGSIRKHTGGLLVHVQEPGSVAKANVLVREWQSLPQFLSIEQISVARGLAARTPHRLLFDLMIRVGLRSCEARTFPLKYVFNPFTRQDCGPGTLIRLRLDPRDMNIKYDKVRDVDIPFSLMADMYSYTVHERNVSERPDEARPELLLTVFGHPYTRGAVAEMLRNLSAKAGFRCTALMLRHSYAVHTLNTLRKSESYLGHPACDVRRAGHRRLAGRAGRNRGRYQGSGRTCWTVADNAGSRRRNAGRRG